MQNDLLLRRTVASWILKSTELCVATNHSHDLGDDLDLNKGSFGQLVDCDARMGGQRFAERFGINRIEGGEVVDVVEEAGGFHHGRSRYRQLRAGRRRFS